ncbi:MAG: prepilin-type N-terminal cleavage/methylation domain-containing protein [Phycisphaera sp.]|nr:prepilin-type N-terminal cleavage/methylation domain-containing protein [Phycisphaera sp.]
MTRYRYAHGFTLVELLVVVSIILLMVAIILPSVDRAQKTAWETRSQINLRQVDIGFLTLATDHRGYLPAAFAAPFTGPEDWQKSWLGSEVGWTSNEGALVPYIGGVKKAQEIYRDPVIPPSPLNSGKGSNGMFDYSALTAFAGARVSAMPNMVEHLNPDTGEYEKSNTPLIVAEDPAGYINNHHVEPSHSGLDRLSNWYLDGGAYYASVDGSVTRLQFQTRGPTSLEWIAQTPSGATVNLDWYLPGGWGGWNHR